MSMAFAVGKRKSADGRVRLAVVDGAQVKEGLEPLAQASKEGCLEPLVQAGVAGRFEPLAQSETVSADVELSLEELAALGVQVGYRPADDGVELVFYRVAADAPTESSTSQVEPVPQAKPAPQADPWADLSDNERTVCELICERGEINALEATNAIGMTPRGGIRLLTGLVHKSVLTYEGSGTKKKYRLAK